MQCPLQIEDVPMVHQNGAQTQGWPLNVSWSTHKMASVAEWPPHRALLLPGPALPFSIRLLREKVSGPLRSSGLRVPSCQGQWHSGCGRNGKHLRAEGELHSFFPNQKGLQSSFPPWVRKIKWYKIQPIPVPWGMTAVKPLGMQTGSSQTQFSVEHTVPATCKTTHSRPCVSSEHCGQLYFSRTKFDLQDY